MTSANPHRDIAPREARETAFNRLKSETFDILVIGGGITGAGIARDAALRGLKVALVEKSDFAAGTSSKSSKLIHGGLRYLEQGHLKLVFEGTNERALQLRVAPHLVSPLPFLVPAYTHSKNSLWKLDVGLWLYDALSLFSSPKLHRAHLAGAIRDIEPLLRTDNLRGGIVYYDCITDDARLTLENILDARSLGAVVLNYAKVGRLLRDEKGTVQGVEVEDCEPSSNRRLVVKAKVTVNATGPWTDEVRALLGEKRMLKPTRGVHVVVDSARLKVNHALLMNAPRDGRVMFTIPWGNRTVIGTTDTFHEGNPDEAFTTRDDAEYILETANHFYPSAKLTFSDVISTWAGLRPLVAPESDAMGASDVSREHFLMEKPGFLTIAGGKLTTYRRIALEVVDAAMKQLGQRIPSATDERPLPGAMGLVGAHALEELGQKLQQHGMSREISHEWAHIYGIRAMEIQERMSGDVAAHKPLNGDLPYLWASVDEAVDYEMALTLTDVLERRAPIILKSLDQGLSIAQSVAQHMGRRLDWNEARTREEVDRYVAAVDLSRRFRVPR